MKTRVSNGSVDAGSAVNAEPFNYEELEQTEVQKLKKHVDSIQTEVDKERHSSVEHALAIGKELEEAQNLLAKRGNGRFIAWCEQECGLSSTTVYRCIRAHRTFKDIPTKKGHTFDLSAIYILSAKNCPPEALSEARERAEAGEVITQELAKTLVDQHKSPAATDEAAAGQDDDDPTPEAAARRAPAPGDARADMDVGRADNGEVDTSEADDEDHHASDEEEEEAEAEATGEEAEGSEQGDPEPVDDEVEREKRASVSLQLPFSAQLNRSIEQVIGRFLEQNVSKREIARVLRHVADGLENEEAKEVSAVQGDSGKWPKLKLKPEPRPKQEKALVA